MITPAEECLRVALESLERFDALHEDDARDAASLEIADTGATETTVRGNVGGLAYLAQCALRLAIAKHAGKHFHFDETGPVEKCDRQLVLGYQAPDRAG